MSHPVRASGTVVATHVWPDSAQVPVAVDELVLDWGGPVGDRHHGITAESDTRQRAFYPRGTEIRNHRQVSIVAEEELTQVAAAMGVPSIAPGLIADNLYVRGVPALSATPGMTRFVFHGGVVLMIGGENHPCTISGALIGDVHGTRPSAFPKAGMHLRGVTAWVEHPGVIVPGETFDVR